MNFTLRASLGLLPLLLAACAHSSVPTSTAVASPSIVGSPTLLGYVEVTAGKISSSEQSVRWVTPTANGFEPLALSQLPTSLQLKGDRNVTWSFDDGKTRYLATTVDVRNVASTPQDTKNVYFMAVDTPQTIGDTAISGILNDDGEWTVDLYVARHIFPTHDVIPPGKVLTIGADFVAFDESEVQGLVPSGGGSLFPWGFAVRHCLENGLDHSCSSFTRTLPASDARNSYDSIVTFSFEAPVLTSASTPDAVKAVYAVYKDVGAQPRITQSVQEQAAGTVAGLNTVPSGFYVTKFPGSKLKVGTVLPNLRISGPASNPTSTLLPVNVTPPNGTSGTLNTNFGDKGVVYDPSASFYRTSDTLTVDDQNRILLGGASSPPGPGPYDAIVTRYTAAGILDSSFGQGGRVRAHFGSANGGDRVRAIALTQDGKILVSVDSGTESGSSVILARYTSQGVLDTSFGNAGKVNIAIGQYNSLVSMTVAPDNKIVLTTQNESKNYLLRYTASGDIDSSFGTAGRVVLSNVNLSSASACSSSIGRSIVTKDNKIIALGCKDPNGTLTLTRYISNGQLDVQFAAAGIANTSIAFTNQAKVTPDGSLIVESEKSNKPVLAKFTSTGLPDTTFGATGVVYLPITVFNNTVINENYYAFGLTSAGDILSLGSFFYPGSGSGVVSHRDVLVTRFTSTGELDSTFGTKGQSKPSVVRSIADDAFGRDVTETRDGKIVGLFTATGSDISPILFELNP